MSNIVQELEAQIRNISTASVSENVGTIKAIGDGVAHIEGLSNDMLNEMIDFNKFIAQDFKGQKFICHCYEGEKKLLKEALVPGEDVLILVGPEGDFSEEEVAKAIEVGFQPVSLGKSRLRTETAALVAAHTLNLFNQK